MPLARVGARTDSTTSYSYNARRGQLPRTRIGIVHRTRARHAVCAEGLHFSAFHYISFGMYMYCLCLHVLYNYWTKKCSAEHMVVFVSCSLAT